MKLYNESLFEKQLPNFAYLDFNQWVQEDVQIIKNNPIEGNDKLNAMERNLLNFFLNHLANFGNELKPFYVPNKKNPKESNELIYNLKKAKDFNDWSSSDDVRTQRSTLNKNIRKLKDKGKLLVIPRNYKRSAGYGENVRFSSLYIPYPIIFLQPAFIQMLDKNIEVDECFDYSLKNLNWNLRKNLRSKEYAQNEHIFSDSSDLISKTIFDSSVKNLSKSMKNNLIINVPQVSKDLFKLKDIMFKQMKQYLNSWEDGEYYDLQKLFRTKAKRKLKQ